MAYRVSAVWQGSSGYGFPRAMRRPCGYEAYVPDRLAELDLVLPVEVVADASDAERAIQELNAESPGLASLEGVARLLLRAEAEKVRLYYLTLAAARSGA